MKNEKDSPVACPQFHSSTVGLHQMFEASLIFFPATRVRVVTSCNQAMGELSRWVPGVLNMHSIRLHGDASANSSGRGGPEERFYERTMMVSRSYLLHARASTRGATPAAVSGSNLTAASG